MYTGVPVMLEENIRKELRRSYEDDAIFFSSWVSGALNALSLGPLQMKVK